MTDRLDRLREYLDENEPDRRLLGLLVLFTLVVAGAGVGTIAFDGDLPPGETDPTPTPPVVEVTPVSPTPTATSTPDPGGGPATATPTATETSRPPSDTETPTSRPPTGGGSSGVDLQTRGSNVLIRLSNVTPGDQTRNDVVFENAGDERGRLGVANASVEDSENGLMDAEKAVDDDATTGELSSALRIRLWITYPGGTTEYLYGSSSDWVPLADIHGENRTSTETLGAGERATVTFACELPASTGNEVQSDTTTFDVDFGFEGTSG